MDRFIAPVDAVGQDLPTDIHQPTG
jgi:hypothetical protein